MSGHKNVVTILLNNIFYKRPKHKRLKKIKRVSGIWNNQVNIIVDPMFPLSVCWCNQGPKSPKGLRTQGGNYHQTLRSSLLLENCAMFSFLTLFISSFQSLCRDTLFRDLVHVGDFIDTGNYKGMDLLATCNSRAGPLMSSEKDLLRGGGNTSSQILSSQSWTFWGMEKG